MARTTPAQKPRGFKSSTRVVGVAESFWPRLGESRVIVVTLFSIPCLAVRQHPSGTCPGAAVTPPQRSPPQPPWGTVQQTAEGFNRHNSKPPNVAVPAAVNSLESRLCLLITADMAAVARQGRHKICVLAVGRAKLLACGGHTVTCHMSAFDRCVRHRILLKWFSSEFRKRQHSTRCLDSLAQLSNLLVKDACAPAKDAFAGYPPTRVPHSSRPHRDEWVCSDPTCSTPAGSAHAPGWSRSASRRSTSGPPRAQAPPPPSAVS